MRARQGRLRRGELWVNEQHPERNTDVVLVLDTLAEVRSGDRGAHDLAVRAATSLAHRCQLRRLPLVALASALGAVGIGVALLRRTGQGSLH